MMTKQTGCVLQMIALCLLAVAVLCQRTPPCAFSEPEDKKQCFYDRGLDLTPMPSNLHHLLPDYRTYETYFTIMDPHAHCRDPEAYSEAMSCALNVSLMCFDPDGTVNLAQDPEYLSEGMALQCRLKDQMDSECFKTFFNLATDCSKYNFRKLGLSPFFGKQDEILCGTTELLYDCVEVLMTRLCGKNSTNIYLEQVSNYFVSPVCKNGLDPKRPRDRHFLELPPFLKQKDGEINNGVTGTARISTPPVLTLVLMAKLSYMNTSPVF